MAVLVPMFISLWITSHVFAWGELGHIIVAENGARLAGEKTLERCHVTATELVAHTNDPDRLWRDQWFIHRNEARMHFFHVDRQPSDWRDRTEAKDSSQGELVYRITEWMEDARRFRQQGKWDTLKERLYGLSHYIGDLTQPLHLHHDHDGREFGLPGLHAQFETKMVNRFKAKLQAAVSESLRHEQVPRYWETIDAKRLIFQTALQSESKVPRLFIGSKPAYVLPRFSWRRRHRSSPPEPRFDNKLLWRGTSSLITDQLAVGARLWGYVLIQICSDQKSSRSIVDHN